MAHSLKEVEVPPKGVDSLPKEVGALLKEVAVPLKGADSLKEVAVPLKFRIQARKPEFDENRPKMEHFKEPGRFSSFLSPTDNN